MRVISGVYRSRKLESLTGDNTRPTIDRVKEAIFASLYNLKNKYFLDLFAGSGSIGIEALSRGASFVLFNENNHNALKIIKKNLNNLKITEGFKLNSLNYLECLSSVDIKFDFIYLDPPFNSDYYQKALDLIEKYQLLNELGIIIIESDLLLELTSSYYQVFKVATYGKIKIQYLRRG
ncbi:MAG: 16S rRNA (guanine(966)-N(2))-methyltransferase RsmD [Erysipelotrichaceae bacterium]